MERVEDAPDFERFVDAYGDRAFRFAYRLTGNVEEAKEIVQESFYRVLRAWDTYDASRPMDAWYFRILKNVFLDARKCYDHRHVIALEAKPVTARESDLSYGDVLPDGEEGAFEAMERRESDELVRSTLEDLPYEFRAVLTLCDMEGMSYEEIARVMDVPLGTVRSRVSRARIRFRDGLARAEVG